MALIFPKGRRKRSFVLKSMKGEGARFLGAVIVGFISCHTRGGRQIVGERLQTVEKIREI